MQEGSAFRSIRIRLDCPQLGVIVDDGAVPGRSSKAVIDDGTHCLARLCSKKPNTDHT